MVNKNRRNDSHSSYPAKGGSSVDPLHEEAGGRKKDITTKHFNQPTAEQQRAAGDIESK